ncbi:MAG TPA: hypothetical protein VKS21_13480, partial [Spirochaetota bacterium]|nr:hypothetical protein [Spirochaetota bacterium]
QFIIPALVLYIFLFLIENMRRPLSVNKISFLAGNKIWGTALSAESQLKSFFAAMFALAMGFLSEFLGVGTALFLCGSAACVLFPLLLLENPDIRPDRGR